MADPADVVILIVDDLRQNLFALEQTLRQVPARVVAATNGEDALAATLCNDFALAILDVQMPGMDGYELAETLMGAPATSRIPIIFVTAAHSDEQHRFKGYRSGAVDYIVKPFDPEILLGKVRVFLELARYRQGLEDLVEERTRALAASEQKYRTLVENAYDIIHHLDMDGGFRYVNAAWENALGYTAADRATLRLHDVLAPEFREAAYARFNRVRRGASEVNFQTAFVTRDGDKVHVEGNVVPDRHEGRIVGTQAFFRDVTGRREAEARLELAVRGSGVGLWDWHLPTGSLYLTGSWPAIEGLPAPVGGRIDARLWAGMVHPEDQPARNAALHGHFERHSDYYEQEIRVRHDDGRWTWLLERGRVLERDDKGTAVRMSGTCMNITDRKAAEAERARLVQAEAESRAKSDFLSRMSHEIRTPLNAILGYAQLLRREAGLTGRQREYLETIDGAGDHLLNLVTQVLDLAHVESGQLPLAVAEVDLRDLLVDVHRMFRMQAAERGLELSFDTDPGVPPRVLADGGKVRQVLINLVGNAMKFTEAGGIDVTVSTGGLPDDGAPDSLRIRIAVKDSGCGIADDDQEAVFDAFRQAEAGARTTGTGLGLALSREFARRMGGDITVASAPGRGSLFTFEFASGRVEGPPRDAVPARRVVGLAAGAGTLRVLVVDPRADDRALLARVLESVGFEVRVSPGPDEALDALLADPPRLVLLCPESPLEPWVDLLARIRALPGDEAVRVLAAGVRAPGDADAPGALPGVDGTVVKPLVEADLLDEIARVARLEYLWSGGSGSRAGTPSEPDRAAVQAVPDDLRKAHRRAVESGYPDAVEREVERVARACPAVGAGLRTLAREFDYSTLLALLSPPREA